MEISGHAAVVTGGASGLGAATARALAERGAKVAILDIDATRGTELATSIGGSFIECNVTDASGAERAFGQAQAAHGAPRILACCAGIAPPQKIVGKDGPMPLDSFRKIVEVNLIGTFNALRLAAAAMSQLSPLDDGERGVIVMTASVAAFDGQIGQPAYAASKGGVVALTLPAARELARSGIRVCAIAPGIFDTPLLASLPEEARRSLAASVPFPQRLGRPDEFAALAVHIVENGMLNGEVIRLDGAIRMAPR